MTEKTRNKKPFGYEDIRVGDLIRITDTHPHGSVITVEGVANYKYAYTWKTAEGISLINDRSPSSAVRVIELLSRPTMPVETGTIISAVLKHNNSEDEDKPVYMVRVDKASDEDEMVWLELTGTGDDFHTEGEIQSWVEMKLVVA